jgi:hypothetical protein
MNLIDLLNQNFAKCKSSIEIIENATVITRIWDKKDTLSLKLRGVQLLGSQLSNDILNVKSSISRSMGSIQYSEKLDAKFWEQLTNANQFQNFILSKVNYPNIPETKIIINQIFTDINNFQNSLYPKITSYNSLIQEVRRHRSRPFSFGNTFGLPPIKEMPDVINLANCNIF